MRDISYPPIIVTAKVLFRALGLRFQLHGTEHVPKTGGALLAFNHVSYIDFVLGGFAAQPSRRLVRFMAKREVFDHSVGGPVMRSMHHISVDRADGGASLDEALRYLQEGEAVGIFPEATISRSFEVKELKSGATRIAAEAGVPLLPVALWGTQRLMTKDHPRDFSRGKTIGIRVGEPMYPSGADPVAETAELRAAPGAGRRGDRRLPRRGAAARVVVAAGLPRRLGPHARARRRARRRGEGAPRGPEGSGSAAHRPGRRPGGRLIVLAWSTNRWSLVDIGRSLSRGRSACGQIGLSSRFRGSMIDTIRSRSVSEANSIAILPLVRPRETLTRVSRRSLSRSSISFSPGAVGRAARTAGAAPVLAVLTDGDELLQAAHRDALGDDPSGEPVLGGRLGDRRAGPGRVRR